MFSIKRSFLSASALLWALPCAADTYVLHAIDDFPIQDAGAVPYYPETERGALAINAAKPAYRNQFARAETTFTGDSGRYDLNLLGLAELDGEAQYRVSINESLVGEAQNPAVSIDYTPIAHKFNAIDLITGDVIGVESLANSNNTIPEGDGYAFARGRWTELRLTPDGEFDVQPDKISLLTNIAALDTTVAVGDEVLVDYAVINDSNAGSTAIIALRSLMSNEVLGWSLVR